MIKKLVIYAEISWDFLDQRHHHLARFFIRRGFEVVFVERVVGRLPGWRELLERFFKSGTGPRRPKKSVPKGLRIVRSLYLPYTYPIFSIWNHLVWMFRCRSLQDQGIVYSFVDSPYILGGRLAFLGRYRSATFDIIHNWWSFPWRNSSHRKLVEQCLEKFDHIVTDSPIIETRLQKRGIKSQLLLPGVGASWFRSCSETVHRPCRRLVFFGNLRSNSDLDLVRALASQYDLDVYGLLSSDVRREKVNFRYLGAVDSQSLPQIVSEYDAIVLPYDNSAFSATISPAKLFEALATGLLIVTRADFSHIPGVDDFVKPVVEIEKFDLENEIILRGGIFNAAQIEFSTKHTWESRFEELIVKLGYQG